MNKKYSMIFIGAAIILTSIVALSTHVLILQNFNPPVIKLMPKFNLIIGFIIRFATILGIMFIYLLSKKYWEHIRPFYRVTLFAILIMALTEQFLRSPIMEIMAGVPWGYQLLTTIPSYVATITLSLLIFLFMPKILRKNELII